MCSEWWLVEEAMTSIPERNLNPPKDDWVECPDCEGSGRKIPHPPSIVLIASVGRLFFLPESISSLKNGLNIINHIWQNI